MCTHHMSDQDLTSWWSGSCCYQNTWLPGSSNNLAKCNCYRVISTQQIVNNLVTTCDKVDTCLAFLYGTVCTRFDQDGYKVPGRLEALLCDHEANLGDFAHILSVYWIDLDLDQQATLLHVLQSYIPRQVERNKVEQKYQ